MDRNVLHLSHEGADLEDPANEPLDDLYLICNRPEDAPDEPEYITLTFEKGNAVKLNGEALTPLAMLEKLNASAQSTASASSTSWKTASSA